MSTQRLVAAVSVLMLALGPAACESDSPTAPSQSPPPATPAAPIELSRSPAGAGFVAETAFAFTVLNVVAVPGNTLENAWEFGDGTAETTSTNTVTHIYRQAGVFSVRVTVSDITAGTVRTAVLSEVRVVDLTGSWGIRHDSGGFVVDRGMFLSQSGSMLRGDVTYVAGCLVAVNGSIRTVDSGGAGAMMELDFTLPPSNGCQPFPIPLPSSFTGIADTTGESFSGMLEGVGAVTISRCANNTTVVNCQ